MSTRLALVAMLMVLATSAPALRAGDMEYTSASAFAAATTGAQTFGFTAPCSTCFVDYTTYTEPTTGTTFSIATSLFNLTGRDYYGPGVYPMDFLVESSTASAVANVLTVTPPSGFSAIAFELGSFNGGPFVVTLSDATAYTINPPAFNGLGFFGFTSTSGISSISFDIPANDTFVIDQGTLANLPTTTPEPTSLLLFGTSLLALAPFRRKLCKR